VALFIDGIEACKEFSPRYQTRLGWGHGEGIRYSEIDQSPVEEEDRSHKEEFKKLAQRWREETGGYSLTYRRYSHPSYHAIFTFGRAAIPLILHELQQRPDLWFQALRVLAETDAASGAKTFDEAVECWLNWGKREKYIS